MPTRWPTGREVRTLLTGGSFWLRARGLDRRDRRGRLGSGRRLLGQRQESSGEVVSPGGVSTDEEDGVVAGDRAEDVGVLDLVERRGQELRGPRRGAEDDEVRTGVGADEQL